MPRKKTTASFSDSFWSNSSQYGLFSTPASPSFHSKQDSLAFNEFLYAVDETPDFHDPYSDLSLFLSDQIKKEICHTDSPAHWTVKLQEELLQKITPEFQKRFPNYRLGIAAVKKIWEKVLFYTKQIQGQSEALDENGKLNIHFFIKENLRQYFQQKALSFLSPYQYAHQIAAKMSECIATLEGTKPKLDLLTQTIWSLQKHLLGSCSLQQFKTPYDELDKVDKLIAKTILETTAKYPHIGMSELEHKTKESLQALHDLPDFSSTAKIISNVSCLLAEKLYSTSPFHIRFFAKQKEAILSFIKKHSYLYKDTMAAPQLCDLVRRIQALYALASQLPKDIPSSLLFQAIEALYTNASNRPPLDQSLYAFLSAELLLIKKPGTSLPLEEIQQKIFASYQEALSLPLLLSADRDLLEVIIWKTLSETEGLLERLPYRIGQKIEEEIANIFIDDPTKGFSSVVHETVQFFKKVKELTEQETWNETEKKVHLWCIQNDMLCRSVRFHLDTPLAKLIEQKKKNHPSIDHSMFIHEVCQEFLQKFPQATLYMGQLSSRAWILYKYLWFTSLSDNGESSFDRFLKWHVPFLQDPTSTEDQLIDRLEELCKKCLPLIPFERSHVLSVLSSIKK